MHNTILLGVLTLICIVAAIYALRAKKTLNAVLASGVISLMAAIMFLVVGAPDVAMTEATIGAGLTTVVFLYALKHTGGSDND